MEKVIFSPNVVPPSIAAAVAGISRQAVYKKLKQGKLTPYDVYGNIWVDHTELTYRLDPTEQTQEEGRKICGYCGIYDQDNAQCGLDFENKEPTDSCGQFEEE